MSKQVGIFIDVSNQFYCINKKWEGKKLDYKKYKEKAQEYGSIARAFAYGTQVNGAASKFISCLYHLDYEPKYRTVEKNVWYSWNVGIAMDMVRLADKLDVVVVGCSDNSMAHVVNYLRDKAIRVIAIGCGLSKDIKEAADQWIEIGEEYLESEQETIN